MFLVSSAGRMQILIRLTIYKEGKLITATSFRDNQLAETRDRYAYAKELYNEPSSLYRVRKWSSTTQASPSVRRLRLLAASYLRDWYRSSHLPFGNNQRKNRLVVRCMFSCGLILGLLSSWYQTTGKRGACPWKIHIKPFHGLLGWSIIFYTDLCGGTTNLFSFKLITKKVS